MFLVPSGWVADEFKLVRSAIEGLDNPPGTCKRVHELLDSSTFRVRASGLSREDDIPLFIDTRVAATGID